MDGDEQTDKHTDNTALISNRYGLAPNYGCCTANFNQGWPKLTQNTVLVSPDGNSFVISIYAPVSIEYEGTVISIDTNYPFNETGR